MYRFLDKVLDSLWALWVGIIGDKEPGDMESKKTNQTCYDIIIRLAPDSGSQMFEVVGLPIVRDNSGQEI